MKTIRNVLDVNHDARWGLRTRKRTEQLNTRTGVPYGGKCLRRIVGYAPGGTASELHKGIESHRTTERRMPRTCPNGQIFFMFAGHSPLNILTTEHLSHLRVSPYISLRGGPSPQQFLHTKRREEVKEIFVVSRKHTDRASVQRVQAIPLV